MYRQINAIMTNYRGLSTDDKPQVDIGSTFYEMDTGIKWIYSEKGWKATSVITKTAEGNPLTINALAGKALELDVTIDAKQSGSGDPSPSNVRPISGRNSVEVTRTGKNLLDTSNAETVTRNGVSFVKNSDGSITASGTSTADWQSKLFSGYLPSGSYELSGGISSSVRLRLGQGSKNTLIGHDSGSGLSFTLTEETLINVNIRFANGADANVTIYPMIRLASETDATWESYTSQIYTATLGQTVYGGTLDLVSGVLTVDKGIVDLGTLTWTMPSQQPTDGHAFRTTNITRLYGSDAVGICEQYGFFGNAATATIASNMQDGQFAFQITNNNVWVRDDRYTTAAEFTTAVNGVHLVYPLATPQTAQLTPQEVELLAGTNNLFTDCENIKIKYKGV